VAWGPGQHLRFADERLRPGFDLLFRRGELPPGRIVELGCGAGVHTKAMAEGRPNLLPDRRRFLVARAYPNPHEGRRAWRIGW
jgi:trans-aconitate 2-methyltransferase